MAKLIIVGQVPPPYHGQSVMIQAMVNGLAPRMDLVLVPMQYSREVDENGDFSFDKVTHLFSLSFRVIRLLLKHRGSVLYYPPAPPKWSTVLRDWVFLSLTRPFAARTVFHFHAYGLGGFLEQHRRLRMLAWPFMRPDAAIVLGNGCRNDADVIRAQQTIVLPYGMDVKVAKSVHPHDDDLPRILFVGLHIESKGILDILDAAQALKASGTRFRIHTVGPWKNEAVRQAFEAKRLKLDLTDEVVCRGELTGSDLWAEYAAADLFFFPTFFEFETFGLVVLEAMAYGLPVVASDWRGPADVVEDGMTGFICATHDATAYAGAIRKLLTDPDLRKKMGRAGRRLYEERYTEIKFIDALETAFKAVMSTKS